MPSKYLVLVVRVLLWIIAVVLAAMAIAPLWIEHGDSVRKAEALERDRKLVELNHEKRRARLFAYRRRAQDCLEEFKRVAPPDWWQGKAISVELVGGQCSDTCWTFPPRGGFFTHPIAYAVVSPSAELTATLARGGSAAVDVPACAAMFEPKDGMGFGFSEAHQFSINERLAMTPEGWLLYAGVHESGMRAYDERLEEDSLNPARVDYLLANVAQCASFSVASFTPRCRDIQGTMARLHARDVEMWKR